MTTVNNVDYYIANSNNVKKRIKMYYQKDSKIIYPPIDLSLFNDGFTVKSVKKRNYYLSFGALVPYKNITLLVDTFNQSGKKLVIIGDGSERKKLEKKANNNISFTGSLPWEKIKHHIIGAKALLFPGEDDFGMIPLEVMAYGLPVIALGKGGALETVIENKIKRHKSSGVFFHKQSIKSLVSAINEFEDVIDKFDSSWIINHARKFGEDIFMDKFSKEVERIARVAFDLAKVRGKKLCSIDKANVIETTEMWREVVSETGKAEYSDIELSHMYVDNASMQLVRYPKQFDVMVTGNMFGDILSDTASMLTGSLGMLPSASLGAKLENGKQYGLYEPVHGSAPDIAGKNIANPIATILSLSMMFRYSFNYAKEADIIEQAVENVLNKGFRTADIATAGEVKISCSDIGSKIIEEIKSLS